MLKVAQILHRLEPSAKTTTTALTLNAKIKQEQDYAQTQPHARMTCVVIEDVRMAALLRELALMTCAVMVESAQTPAQGWGKPTFARMMGVSTRLTLSLQTVKIRNA
jgi:hypothetical protein